MNKVKVDKIVEGELSFGFWSEFLLQCFKENTFVSKIFPKSPGLFWLLLSASRLTGDFFLRSLGIFQSRDELNICIIKASTH